MFSLRICSNGFKMMSVTVVKMELKDDGESLVIHTMLYEGFSRKFVVKIRDIQKHSSPEMLFSILNE